MKISYNWLKQFINIDWNSQKTGELLTDLGLEVLDKVVEMLADVAEVEKQGELEGRRQTIVLSAK